MSNEESKIYAAIVQAERDKAIAAGIIFASVNRLSKLNNPTIRTSVKRGINIKDYFIEEYSPKTNKWKQPKYASIHAGVSEETAISEFERIAKQSRFNNSLLRLIRKDTKVIR